MLTYDEARQLEGHWIKVFNAKRTAPNPSILVKVINETSARVQPKNHKRLETVSLTDCMRHEKAEAIRVEHRAAHEMARAVENRALPADVCATSIAHSAPHLVVDLKNKRFFNADHDFVPAVNGARLYSSYGMARVARGRILFGSRFRDLLSSADVEVVSTERARELAIEWASLAAPEQAEAPTAEIAAPEPLPEPVANVVTTHSGEPAPMVAAECSALSCVQHERRAARSCRVEAEAMLLDARAADLVARARATLKLAEHEAMVLEMQAAELRAEAKMTTED